MATKAAVATGLLPSTASGTVDLTVSGFGTVSAAIIFCTEANSTNNPETAQTTSIGFWDGVNSVEHVTSQDSEDGLGTTISGRSHLTTKSINIYNHNTTTVLVDADCSAITDGIRLTVGTDNTSVSRYISAFLIGGATDVHLETVSLGTGTSPIDITAPGFKPSIVFFTTVGLGSVSAGSVAATQSFGVAHNSSTDTVTQAAVYMSDQHGQTTSVTGTVATHSYVCAQYYADTVNWQASVGSFDASGFSITPTASAGNDIVSYLAIQLADPDDGWVDIIDAATGTGSTAYTGTGFTPDAIGLIASSATTLDTHTNGLAAALGLSDATRERCLAVHSSDAVTTSDANSASSDSALYTLLASTGGVDATATVASMDADGFTLNYSDAAAAANKILAFAIGDSTAGGGVSVPIFHRYYSNMRMR